MVLFPREEFSWDAWGDFLGEIVVFSVSFVGCPPNPAHLLGPWTQPRWVRLPRASWMPTQAGRDVLPVPPRL